VCQLVYLHNNGDTWMFMVLTDRIPILDAGAAAFFFRSPRILNSC